jgi:S-adenosylmethionine:tRNA ribosyltransferase-isomerase
MMHAATWPRAEPLDERLLVVDAAREQIRDAHVRDLPALLAPGDALIVNDAATLPASLHTRVRDLEVRLAGHAKGRWDVGSPPQAFTAVVFGPGDFRAPTEAREPPRALAPGEQLDFGEGLSAQVTSVDAIEPRLVELRFEQTGDALYRGLYRHGRPIQYAYVREPLALFHVQSRFASTPWAFEPPSAGRPLTFGALRALQQAGVHLGHVTHAAGISSTGSVTLDARFPLPERYAIHASAVAAVNAARRAGGRVIAAGTTVARALEACALEHGALVVGQGIATLRLGPQHALRVVDGIFTGMHAPGTSHFELLEAFAPRALLERMDAHANAEAYVGHELGDSCLLLARRALH